MKLPNGFGSVYKLPGNRRKPWIARKTTGWTPEGKQKYYTIGYYKTREEAISALTEYNKNPIGERKDITLKELYEEWSHSKYPKLGAKTVQTYKTAWIYFEALEDAKVADKN